MYKAKDLTGLRFGQLTVIQREGTNAEMESTWRCLCTCGKASVTTATRLRLGRARSCGCLKRPPIPFKHGQSRRGATTPQYDLWKRAKRRAREAGLPFNIDISDIVIPERCPVMGMALKANKGIPQGDSPSVDKIIPHLGYVKGNVWVISYRANAFKSNFTVEELTRFVAAIQGRAGIALERKVA